MNATSGRPRRIYLADGELAILMREANGPANGRVVSCGFGPGAVWLHPGADGNYPRWIMLRLAWLRGLSLDDVAMSDAERAELAEFAAAHPRPAAGEAA